MHLLEGLLTPDVEDISNLFSTVQIRTGKRASKNHDLLEIKCKKDKKEKQKVKSHTGLEQKLTRAAPNWEVPGYESDYGYLSTPALLRDKSTNYQIHHVATNSDPGASPQADERWHLNLVYMSPPLTSTSPSESHA